MKKYITLLIFTLTFFSFIFSSGCMEIFPKYQPTNEYDLTLERVKSNHPILVYQFRNDSSSGARFQYKEKFGSITTDPYNAWVSEPGRLVTRSLNYALNSDGKTPLYKVNGSIDTFEVDKEKKIFHFSGFYSFIRPKRTEDVRFSIEIPIKKLTSENIALAASTAVHSLAARIVSNTPITK